MSLQTVHPTDLEPSRVAARTYATRRRVTRIDVVVCLSVTICLLYILPGTLIVPNLTYAGRPALLLSLGLFCWWVLSRLNPRLTMTGSQPIRWAALAYLGATLLSYLAGLLRGLPTTEANAQDFAVLLILQALGLMLVAADGLPNWERLTGMLRVLMWCAAFMSVVGILQAILAVDITQYFAVPGLELKGGTIGFSERGAGQQFRVAGTATHYIEFGAVTALALPFAIHFARFAHERRTRRMAAVAAVLIAAAVPLSISRTGILALVLAMIVMAPIWNWRTRYNFLIVAIVLGGAFMVVRPGLLGTLRYMFFATAEEDPSIEGRTQDYTLVWHWFSQRPLLGRGPNTLIPQLYNGIVLDNQWLYTLVTGGVLGVLAFAGVHITAITLARIAMKRSHRAEEQHLCAALISTQVISIVVAGTVDSLYFTTFSMTVALLTGVCGAAWRLTHPARTIRTSTVVTSQR